MSEWLLLRHAQAQPIGTDGNDFVRALTPRGHAQAAAVGAWLKRRGIAPVRVLCSPARRARMTLDELQTALGQQLAVTLEAGIYGASTATLLELLERHASVDRTLLVGHNPGLSTLLTTLCGDTSTPPAGLPPASLARVDLPAGTAPGHGHLLARFTP